MITIDTARCYLDISLITCISFTLLLFYSILFVLFLSNQITQKSNEQKKALATESLKLQILTVAVHGKSKYSQYSLHNVECTKQTNKHLCLDKNTMNEMDCSVRRKVEWLRINSPGSFPPACRNTAQWAEVCSAQTFPTAPQPPLSHWWSCPWGGHVRHAAYQTAGQTSGLSRNSARNSINLPVGFACAGCAGTDGDDQKDGTLRVSF